MFLFTFKNFSNDVDQGSAIATDAQDALNQVVDQLSRKNGEAQLLKLSNDPQSAYFMEKRIGIPSADGPGWTNDPRGRVELVYVSTGAT